MFTQQSIRSWNLFTTSFLMLIGRLYTKLVNRVVNYIGAHAQSKEDGKILRIGAYQWWIYINRFRTRPHDYGPFFHFHAVFRKYNRTRMHSSRMRTVRPGGLRDRDPPRQRPLDRDSSGQRLPQTETPLDRDPSILITEQILFVYICSFMYYYILYFCTGIFVSIVLFTTIVLL